MREFLRLYWRFLAISIVMFLAAALLYMLAYQDPKVTERQVGNVVSDMDRLYARGAGPEEKRQEVLEGLIERQKMDFAREIEQSLAEALVLAGIMILTAEGFTRFLASKEEARNQETIAREFRVQADKISENVWNAIFNRLVPEPIGTEIKRVLKSDVGRIRPTYTVILSNAGYTDVPDGYVVVKRQMYYRLQNLTGGPIQSPVTITITPTTVDSAQLTASDGTSVTLPRICGVQINREAQRIENRTSFAKTVSLPKMTGMEQEMYEVYSEVEGLSLTTDRSLYVLTAPCIGIEVQVINQMPELIEVQSDGVRLTSGPNQLRLTTPLRWACDDGLLTGTALSVPWRAVKEKKPKNV